MLTICLHQCLLRSHLLCYFFVKVFIVECTSLKASSQACSVGHVNGGEVTKDESLGDDLPCKAHPSALSMAHWLPRSGAI